MTIDQIRDAVNKDVFATLGVQQNKTAAMSIGDIDNRWMTLVTFDLNPAMCGPVGAIFAKLQCDVSVGYGDDRVVMCYEYSYIHPSGGRNGYKLLKPLPSV